MEKVKYNAEFFDILKDLVTISNSVIIKKEENQVISRKSDANVTIGYSLKAPREYFDFSLAGDEIAFYNYGEFYQYFRSFKNPEIYIENEKIILKENNSKIDYVLSNPESFDRKVPKEPLFGESDISFDFSPSDHDEIIKMITLIKPKKARIIGDVKAGKVTLIIFNNIHSNSFEKVFNITNLNKNQEIENIDFQIFSDTFLNIPPRRNYAINIKAAGFVKISLLNNKMNLDIYTGKIKSN